MIGFNKVSGVITRQNQAGLGLIELMISITIGLMIMAGVVQLYVTSVTTEQSQEGISRIQENMRYAMSRLEKDISQSGFMGCLIAFENSDRVANVLGDQSGLGEKNGFTSRIDGFEGTEAMGSDQLFVRYASAQGSIPLVEVMDGTDGEVVVDDSFTAYNTLTQYQVVMVSDCSMAAVFMITNDPSGSGGTLEHVIGVVSPPGKLNEDQFNTSAELNRSFSPPGFSGQSAARLYLGTTGTYNYRIDTSAAGTAAGGVCAAGTTEFCALFRNEIELVEGVEDFQVEYGVNNGSLRFEEADLVATSEWNNVDRVRVTLVFNSVQTARTLEGQDLITKTATKVIMVRNELPEA